MVDLLDDPSVGLVGNLQLKDGGEWHGTIDSAGSEWHWEQMNFLHIGRHIYKNKLLKNPMSFEECPSDLLEVGEREMVTGCCFAIRKDLYNQIGGFNHNYRIGYWEDSEICMTLKSMGYKIMYQPNSIIYHKLHHTKSNGHKFHEFNKQYFFNKWVESEVIDQYVQSKRIVKASKVCSVLVRRRAAHGDVLMATSILPGIKLKYPNAKIYFCTDCPEVLKNNLYIDGIIPKSQLHKTSFQQIYNLDYAYERMPLVNILKAYSLEANIQSSDPYLSCEPIGGLPEKYITIHAGKTAWVGRNWNEELFLEIANKLEKLGYNVVWVGNENEGGRTGNFDFRGRTSIQQLGTIMKNSQLFIGIDSFPFHVAQVMKTPGVCFFGAILPHTRIINTNMKPVIAERLKCLGCHHRKFAPATVTNECENGTLDCENLVTLCIFWEKIKEQLCNQNV
jgi:ADP-heptose:LPS heptosyltransferase